MTHGFQLTPPENCNAQDRRNEHRRRFRELCDETGQDVDWDALAEIVEGLRNKLAWEYDEYTEIDGDMLQAACGGELPLGEM